MDLLTNMDTQITILIENTVRLPRLIAEHGWAVLIENKYGKVLFDTGQSSEVLRNAALLNIDMSTIDKIVISHGHYDHTGGLAEVLEVNPGASVFTHPDVFKPKFYMRPGGTAREIGMPINVVCSNRFSFSRESIMLFPGCLTTGEIPKSKPDLTPRCFFENSDVTSLDLIKDDQALIIESKKGLVVVLGCCHSGLKATFDQVKNLTGQSKIYMVIGGMHLVDASPEMVEQTIQALREYSVMKIGLGHCTGYLGAFTLQTAFPNQCFPCITGVKIKV